ncbi:MAG: TIGR00730 family Rossman fold protein [Candidatus Komeilibacteria bacterium]|nr:TIGR00730 family Rossman fold protein [Candidatus Komeilibacteria bacterium]
MSPKKNFDPVICRIPRTHGELTHEDLDSSANGTWRIFRIMAEFVSGFQFISHLKKSVSIFGSARLKEDSPYYQDARRLGYLLGKAGYEVITGGGPGIMEAGNRGDFEATGQSIGLNIQLPFNQRTNPYVTKGLGFHYFFTRKVMLAASAQAYVFFPGGFGTMDEFFEVVTLVQTKKMARTPIVLMGRDYWQPLLEWIDNVVCKKIEGIHAEDMGIYTLVSSPEEALKIIKKSKPREDF